MLQLSGRPGRQKRLIKRSGEPDIPNYGSDWRIDKLSSHVHVRIFGYQNIQFWFQYFYVGQPKIIADHPGYHLGGPLGEPGFFVSCSTGACMMWWQRVTQICDCNNSVSVPWTWRLLRPHQLTEVLLVQLTVTATMNLAFPIRLLASAFIFLLSHLKLITLPMHSPTTTRHNITSKDKFGTGTPHLADMPTAVHRQNSWKITGWSHGTVSMAMHCLGYNKLTPDGSLANHVLDTAVAVAVFDTGSEALFFPDSPHRTTVHPLRPFLLKLYQWQM